jgi:branched-chain amino acid transport system substrate-binding protein
MRRLRALLALLLLAGVAGCGQGGAAKWDGKETLRVGVILPMSGDQATYGEESWNGLLLAQEDLRGDEVTPAFELIHRDEKSDKKASGDHAKTLIESDRVHVLIGSVASSNTKQIFTEARESGIPCISPASTRDVLTEEGGRYTSRICFKDSFQGAVLARFALSQGWRKTAAVVDKSQDYAIGLAQNFEPVFKDGGGTVSTHYYVTQDTDFSSVIENVAREQPDVIFISGYYGQAGPMIRQAKGSWDGKPIIGGDGLDSEKLSELMGDTPVAVHITSHFAADEPDAATQAFAKRYKERFGKAPGAMAALGYDVLFVLIDAAKRARDAGTPAELAEAIAQTQGLKVITGTIDLTTPDRTPVKDAVIVRLDGTFKFHKKIPAPR